MDLNEKELDLLISVLAQREGYFLDLIKCEIERKNANCFFGGWTYDDEESLKKDKINFNKVRNLRKKLIDEKNKTLLNLLGIKVEEDD